MELEILKSISLFCEQLQHEFVFRDVELDGYNNIGNEKLITYLYKMLCVIDESPDNATEIIRLDLRKVAYYFQYDNTKAAYVHILFEHEKGEQEIRLKSIVCRSKTITQELKLKSNFIPIEPHPSTLST